MALLDPSRMGYVSVAVTAALLGPSSVQRSGVDDGVPSSAALFSALPLAFVENAGQWQQGVLFVARRGDMVARLDRDSIWLELRKRTAEDRLEGAVVRLVFEGASEQVEAEGEEPHPGAYAFFLGNDPSRWRTGVSAYGAVRYEGVYEGVDLRVREKAGVVEYDVLLDPGADLNQIVVRCEGIEDLELETDGSLRIKTAKGVLRQSPPETWMESATGDRESLRCRFKVLDEERFGFEVEGRDLARFLVIDPGLEWSTFLGGSGGSQSIRRVVVDGAGLTTVVGETTAAGFPTTLGAFDSTWGGAEDAFVAQFDPGQTGAAQLLWSTFLGGSQSDYALNVAVSASGVVTVGGYTLSSDFPTTPASAFDPTSNGAEDGYLVRLDPAQVGIAQLVYSTFLGHTALDAVASLLVDGAGVVTMTGVTSSPSFPTTPGAYDTTHNGLRDWFVARLDPGQAPPQQLLYSTFLGGSGDDDQNIRMVADASGGFFLNGRTTSPDFPTTPGAFQRVFGGGIPPAATDGVVARVDPSLPGAAQLTWSTYLGGSGFDDAPALALDGAGGVFVAGWTGSFDFPTTPGAYDTTHNGGCACTGSPPLLLDGYVSRLDPSQVGGAQLVWSTFFGGSGDEGFLDIQANSGIVTLTGSVNSANFPTTLGAFDTTFNGGGVLPYDAFAVRLDPGAPGGAQLLYSTYLGGSFGSESGAAIALGPSSWSATIAGITVAGDFPTTPGAFDSTFNGGSDSFLARLDMLPAGACCSGVSPPGCAGPLATGVNSMPKVGNAGFAITCTNAPPNGVGVLGVSLALLPSPGGVLGIQIWLNPLVLLGAFPASSNAQGWGQVGIPIPGIPTLAGGQFFMQFVWLSPTSPAPCPPLGLSASNPIGIALQP